MANPWPSEPLGKELVLLGWNVAPGGHEYRESKHASFTSNMGVLPRQPPDT